MFAYIIRRLLYAIPIVLGVMLITFTLFFLANSPEDMARNTLGAKATPEKIDDWIAAHGYDLPRFYNGERDGLQQVTQTLFFQKCARLLVFDLGRSDASDRDIASEIRRRMMPSLTLTVPTFILGLSVNITISLIVAFCRGTYLDRGGTVMCVLMMSVAGLFYIIGGQFLFAKYLRLFPISGFDWGTSTAKFVFLPVTIGVIRGIGGGVRFHRTVMLEEVSKDYVRTARAKGLGEGIVMFRHVLKNAMIPILTGAVTAIPFLFMGSLVMESFFSIPGLGSMMVQAIQTQDFAVVRSMNYIGALLFVLALLLADISYTLADPRIRLGAGGRENLYGQPSASDIVKALVGFGMLFGAATGIYFLAKALGKVKWRVPPITNGVLVIVLAGVVGFYLYARKVEMWRRAWRQLRRGRTAMVCLGILSVYVLIAVLDSVSWRDAEQTPGGATALTAPRSVLDRMLSSLDDRQEKTYSAPMADKLFVMEPIEEEIDGEIVVRRDYPPLAHPGTHLMGTDKTGQDVVHMTIKSVRTGLVVGALTTLIAVPFALFFGVIAGFFGGWVDDAVQYMYATLSSIPSILLIACFMLVFGQGVVQLCVVMGLTGWVALCRLLRGETLKLREQEYVQAALALGVSKFRIIARHVAPNLMHLVLISVVLRVSGLVFAETMLSYLGIGVGPDTESWGSMINQARSELGRDPVIWWNLAAAFVAMFALVLSTNLFGDALRDALDPSLRVRGEGDR